MGLVCVGSESTVIGPYVSGGTSGILEMICDKTYGILYSFEVKFKEFYIEYRGRINVNNKLYRKINMQYNMCK